MTKYFSKHPIIFLISFGLVVCCCLGGIYSVAQVGRGLDGARMPVEPPATETVQVALPTVPGATPTVEIIIPTSSRFTTGYMPGAGWIQQKPSKTCTIQTTGRSGRN